MTYEWSGQDLVYQAITQKRVDEINAYPNFYENTRKYCLYTIFVLSFMTEFTFATIHSEYIEWKRETRLIAADCIYKDLLSYFCEIKKFQMVFITFCLLIRNALSFSFRYRYYITSF